LPALITTAEPTALDFPPDHDFDLAMMFAQCADRASGFADLTHACPICREDLGRLAKYRRAVRHLDECFFDLAGALVKEDARTARAIAEHEAFEADRLLMEVPVFVREDGATYSIRPTRCARQRLTVGGRRFRVGGRVAVLTRPTPTPSGEAKRYPVCVGIVAGIAEQSDSYGITPREVTLELVCITGMDGRAIAGLESATVGVDLVAPIEQAEMAL